MSLMFDSIQNERGESLVSVTIAMLIIAIAALVAMPTLMGSRTQVNNLRTNTFCQDLSKNILAQIRSNGQQTKVYRAPSTASSITFSDPNWRNDTTAAGVLNPGGVISEHGIGPALDTLRWPNQNIMQWNGTRFVSNAPRLIYSSMNLLQALNNGFGNQSCLQPEGLPVDATFGLGNLLTPTTLAQYAEAGYFVSASIKTVPFNVADETDQPCNPNLRLRPFGAQEPPMTDDFRITADDPAVNGFGRTYTPNLGIRAEVFVTVDHIDPAMRGGKFMDKCSNSEKFQYNRVISQIPYPEFDLSGNLRITLTSPAATAGRPRQRLTGRFLACTYEYQINTVATASFTPGAVVGNLNEWVPCEQVSVCGSPPPTRTEGEFQITYQFDRRPAANCNFAMRMMAFDAVGNSLLYPSFLRCWGGGAAGCCEEEGTPGACGGGMGRPAYE